MREAQVTIQKQPIQIEKLPDFTRVGCATCPKCGAVIGEIVAYEKKPHLHAGFGVVYDGAIPCKLCGKIYHYKGVSFKP